MFFWTWAFVSYLKRSVNPRNHLKNPSSLAIVRYFVQYYTRKSPNALRRPNFKGQTWGAVVYREQHVYLRF